MSNILEIENLHFQYGEIVALRGISLNVGEGEVVTLLGGNGAGKTTTLTAISGLVKTDSGAINFLGRDIIPFNAQQVVAEVKKFFPRKVFSQPIPRSVRLSEAPSYGKPIRYFDKYSKGSQAYADVTKELLERI